jgi:hypothetical protein
MYTSDRAGGITDSRTRARGWSSATFESAIEKKDVKLILVQAASFALFLVMSQAWNDAFKGLIQAVVPAADDGSIGLKFANAIASTVFCILLLLGILCALNGVYDRKEDESCTCCCCVHIK